MRYLSLFVTGIIVVGGCASYSKSVSDIVCSTTSSEHVDSVVKLRDYLTEKHFRAAFIQYQHVKDEWTDSDEGALQYELNSLESQTARFGRKEWDDIMTDPRIDVSLKIILVREIDEQIRGE